MKKILLSSLFVFGSLLPLKAVTVSTTTINVGPYDAIRIQKNESVGYVLNSSFTGTAFLERSYDATNWEPIGISSTNNTGGGTISGTLYAPERSTLYRWNASTITAGSFAFSLSDNDDFVTEQLNNKFIPITKTYDDSFRVEGDIIAEDLDITGILSADTTVSTPYLVLESTYSIANTTATYVGQLALDGNYDLYIASGTDNKDQWIKIGGQ